MIESLKKNKNKNKQTNRSIFIFSNQIPLVIQVIANDGTLCVACFMSLVAHFVCEYVCFPKKKKLD